jgi:HEAT repeat protein
MIKSLKLWKLSGALRRRGHAEEAYAAVLELGRMGTDRAIDLLVQALDRDDGVARAAARELGRLGCDRAVEPLARLLARSDASQAAAEALARLGAKAVPGLIEALRSATPDARRLAASALGAAADKRGVAALVLALQADDDYAVRTAAATALGQLKDQRAIWALVGVLKLRDEIEPERRAAQEQLRQAATMALRKLGDPFATNAASEPATAEAVVEKLEKTIDSPDLHPRLLGDIVLLKEAELVWVLKELLAASEECSWANVERRPPLLAPYFASYEQRRRTAEIIGTELHRRGGATLLGRVLEQDLGGHSAIRNWWKEAGLT